MCIEATHGLNPSTIFYHFQQIPIAFTSCMCTHWCFTYVVVIPMLGCGCWATSKGRGFTDLQTLLKGFCGCGSASSGLPLLGAVVFDLDLPRHQECTDINRFPLIVYEKNY